jgi:hypothetical protein
MDFAGDNFTDFTHAAKFKTSHGIKTPSISRLGKHLSFKTKNAEYQIAIWYKGSRVCDQDLIDFWSKL